MSQTRATLNNSSLVILTTRDVIIFKATQKAYIWYTTVWYHNYRRYKSKHYSSATIIIKQSVRAVHFIGTPYPLLPPTAYVWIIEYLSITKFVCIMSLTVLYALHIKMSIYKAKKKQNALMFCLLRNSHNKILIYGH